MQQKNSPVRELIGSEKIVLEIVHVIVSLEHLSNCCAHMSLFLKNPFAYKASPAKATRTYRHAVQSLRDCSAWQLHFALVAKWCVAAGFLPREASKDKVEAGYGRWLREQRKQSKLADSSKWQLQCLQSKWPKHGELELQNKTSRKIEVKR